jgi:hypothetical protein
VIKQTKPRDWSEPLARAREIIDDYMVGGFLEKL